jgi:hypothetical protein
MPNPRVAERRAAQKNLRNPPFDKRITSLAPAGGRQFTLQRGKLVSKQVGGTNVTGAAWTLHFLYNPSTIEATHSVDMDLLAEAERNQYDVSSYAGDSLSQVSWSLLFDRTYETWDRSYRDKPAGKYGVYADVRALYGLLGMVKQTRINGIDLLISPMTVVPAQVYFGGAGSLSYYGRIESATVQYTHWTTKMIPNRAVIGLAMKIFPKTAMTGGGSSGGGSSRGGKTPTKKRRTVPRTTTGPDGRFDGKPLPV